MTSASSASHNFHDTTKDVRQGVREIGKAASAASGDIQTDLNSLREDFVKLAEQVGDILADKGAAALRRAKGSVGGVVSDAQDKGREAVGAMRDVSDNFVGAIDDSIKHRPYATLAIVAGIGFLFGATWRH
jgi:ElaB/YqjD/DUF883 family membrane-anchored ribosome-binding protein